MVVNDKLADAGTAEETEDVFDRDSLDWVDLGTTPRAVVDLGCLVMEAQRPGSYFEFVDGCLYEVLLERIGALPRVRVRERLDFSSLPRLHLSAKALLATVAAAGVIGTSLGAGVFATRHMPHRRARAHAHALLRPTRV